jgi:hypothetical protein
MTTGSKTRSTAGDEIGQVVLKDRQSREFIAATDKVNGEVTTLDVSLSVVK